LTPDAGPPATLEIECGEAGHSGNTKTLTKPVEASGI
jgi:hypothetical protein